MRCAIMFVFAVVLVVAPWAHTLGAQATETSSPSPSPTPTAITTPQPPSEALVAATLTARRNARLALRKWNRARRCFDKPARHGPRFILGRGMGAAYWEATRDAYRALRLDYRERFHKLRHVMRRPGGAARAARWKPLALWVGWPRSAWPMLAKVMQRESTSCPRRLNASGPRSTCGWATSSGVALAGDHGR